MREHGHRSPECVALAERLSEYLDGELPQELRREVEKHFRDCAECESFLDSLARIKNLARSLREPLLAKDDLERIAERAKDRLEE